jgi:serine phosphatase RsbU (regulator of sigma subunit)
MSQRPGKAEIPVAFISSTSEDLKKYREGARDAALGARFHPDMQESFTVSGARPPLAECLARVSQADVLVVLVAHRYGWVPPDQAGADHKSITWLECDQAVRCGQEVLAFILDDNFAWPEEYREEHQIVVAVRDGKGTPELLADVQRRVARLRDFKKWLNERGIRALFTTPEDLRGKVSDALREWRARHREFAPPGPRHTELRGMEADTFTIQQHLVAEYARDFVGRGYVDRELDRFVAEHGRGYVVVRGAPGQGKTAFAAHLVKARGLVHHFVSRSGGRSDARLILRSLVAQLIARAEIDRPVPDALPELHKALEDLVTHLAAREKPFLLVIDALDELPGDWEDELSFLVTEGLPEGAYVVVTTRPGERLDWLVKTLRRCGVPEHVYPLGPLELAEMAAVLRARAPGLSAADVERVAEASQGNALYLTAVVDELAKNPAFDLRDLPAGIEGFFERAVGNLRAGSNALRLTVLGLLTVARKPLSLPELSQITGVKQRQLDDHGIRPIQQFLFELGGGYCFYHARFRDFVTRALLYEDELPDFHALLAGWLSKPDNHGLDYRWSSLAYHLYEAHDRPGLRSAIDEGFLAEKVRRQGYAVLEDVELLSRDMLEEGNAGLVGQCVALVEGLRAVVGGDLIEETRRAVQGYRPGPAAFRSRVLAPPVPGLPGLDVYAAMLPKGDVGADFFEVLAVGDQLVLAVGDAPGGGLKGAFVARFVGNAFRRLVGQVRPLRLEEALGDLNRMIAGHDFFSWVTMQCAAVDLRAGVVTLANAGHPYPVLYAARRGKCDRLPVRGDPLHSEMQPAGAPTYAPRRVEIGAGDVLVLLTDGLTEGNRLTADRYGYRFMPLVEGHAGQAAKAIGEAILDHWRAHPREDNYPDDVTLLVVKVGA